MNCRNCPLGKEDFERRIYWYEKTVSEQGIPNEIYGDETYEEAANDAEQFLWCEKAGGKVYCCGLCSDAHSDTPTLQAKPKRKKRTKRERFLNKQSHLKRLNIPNKRRRRLSSVYKKKSDAEKIYFARLYRSQMSRYWKKKASRAVRRYKGDLQNGRNHTKVYNFWRKYC